MPSSLELEPASSPPPLDEIRPNLDLPARGEHLPDLTFLSSPRSPARPSSWSRQTPAIWPDRAAVCLCPSGRGRRRRHGYFTFKSLGFPVIYRWAYESWPNFKEPPEPFRSFSFSPPRESCMKALKFIYIIMYMPLGFRSKAPEVSNLSQLGP
jgi:hypothetical protein